MSNPFTIKMCIQRAAELVTMSDSPRLDVEILLASVINRDRTYLFTWPEKTLTPEQETCFEHYFQRRLAGEPVAHIIGQREFWSLPLLVNDSTLIPRPDTELLVEAVLDLYTTDSPSQTRHLLDLGTGTGAIVLAIASEKKQWRCVGADNSAAAISLARTNCARLGFGNVQIIFSDWFSAIADTPGFDVIVSNPPYIDPSDPHLQVGDVRFEPLSALVAANHGLGDIEFIVQHAGDYLLSDGWLLVEHGYDQAEAVRNIFSRYDYRHILSRQDLGANERVTLGQKAGIKL